MERFLQRLGLSQSLKDSENGRYEKIDDKTNILCLNCFEGVESWIYIL